MLHATFLLVICTLIQLQVKVWTGTCGTYRKHYYATCSYSYISKWKQTYACGWLWRYRCTRYYYKYNTGYRRCSKYYNINDSWASWGSWGSWGSCSRSCGHGLKTRYRCRSCRHNYISCYSSGARASWSTSCYLRCCTRHGSWSGWSSWNNWGSCSKSCGGGVRQRYQQRYCNNPSPSCGGSSCSGSSRRYYNGNCNTHCCPRNGGWTGWGHWQSWSSCTQTCGGGRREHVRYRSCSNPSPHCGGSGCSGASSDREKSQCNTHCCQKNASWVTWGRWTDIGACSQSCDKGVVTQMRTRKCVYPDPLCKGKGCVGAQQSLRTMGCMLQECPELCVCKASGDPHYRTFDGEMIHFMGTSKYTLAKSTTTNDKCSFNVEVKNEHRYGNYKVSYTKYVDVAIMGKKIGLRKNGLVLVDGQRVFLPFTSSGGGLRVTNIGDNTYISTGCDIKVRFEWEHLVTVIVPGSYRNKMTGICGNCNGLQDDFRTKDGVDVRTKNNKYTLIGNSYDVDKRNSNSSLNKTDWEPNCNVRMKNLVHTDAFCGLIKRRGGVFDACIKNGTEVANEYYESCKIDVCENDNDKMIEKIKCETLESFAEECKLLGFSATWRSSKFCPVTCDDPNKEYKQNGPGCPTTCIEPEGSKSCNVTGQEGCFCKTGFVLSDNKCVPKSQCGCVERKGGDVEYYPLGHTKVSKTCTASSQCKNINGKPRFVPIPSAKQCHPYASCILNSDGERVCVCKNGFFGDGYQQCSKINTINIPSNTKRTRVSIRFTNDYDTTIGGNLNDFITHMAKALSEILEISLYRVSNLKVTAGSVIVTFDVLPKRRGTNEPSLSDAINALHRKVRLQDMPITDSSGRQLFIDRDYFSNTVHVARPCECYGQGDPHYKTYDGAWIHFMGTCKYTLTKSTLQNDTCAFNVEVKNEHRGYNKAVSYTKYVEIYTMETKIGFYKGGTVLVNGAEQFLPYTARNGDIKVFKSGRYMQMVTSCDVKVEFDGYHYVKVNIPDRYRNHTSGICGVCNELNDDFKTKDGTPVSNDRNGQTLIGKSYVVNEDSEDGCGDIPSAEECSTEMKILIPTNEYCGLITNKTGPFADCIDEDSDAAKKEYDNCRFDMCAYQKDKTQLKNAKCKAIEGFAALSLPCKDPNSEYKAEGTACPATCMDLRAPANCQLHPREGCFCKDGYIMSHDVCVPKSKCGCVDNEGNYFPIGKAKVSQECGQALVCTDQLNGPAKFLMKTVSKKCHRNAECVNDEYGKRRCVCKKNFIGDGYDRCDGVPGSMNRVSIRFRLLQDFTKTVGNDTEKFIAHMKTTLATLMRISKSRLVNLRVQEGSIIVTFDMLPKRPGSSEPSIADSMNKLISDLSNREHKLMDLNGNILNFDASSVRYIFDTSKQCTCTGSGDPHYRTFDGQMIHFMGTDRYTMVKSLDETDDCSFNVDVHNEHRYGNYRVSYTKNVYIRISGSQIELQKGGISLVDKKRIFIPFTSGDGSVEIRNVGGNIHVNSNCGLEISFERNHLVTVKVPGRYRGNLTGICGDCDGKKNDFRTADGADVSGSVNKYSLIGESYQVGDTENKTKGISDDDDKDWKLDCSVTMQSMVDTDKYCGLLKSNTSVFKDCIANDPTLTEVYYESCKMDVCENELSTSLEAVKCQSIQAFAEECVEDGYTAKWRSETFCPMKCEDPNMEYKDKGPGCSRTCVDPNGNNPCPVVGTSGCFCKEGYVLSDQHCVPLSQCGCIDVKGDYHPLGYKKVSPTCVRSEECKRVNGRSVFVKVTASQPCHTNATCQRSEKGEQMCICKNGFFGDGYKNCKEITTIRVTKDTKRVRVSIRFKNDFHSTVGNDVGGLKEHLTKAIAEYLRIENYRVLDLTLAQGSVVVTFYLTPERGDLSASSLQESLNKLHLAIRKQTLPLSDSSGNKLISDPEFFHYSMVTKRPCTCTGQGDPHYKTYDGQWIDFMGTCKYTLTESTLPNDTCAFHVKVKNEHRGSNLAVSYTKYVGVSMFGVNVTLQKGGGLLINGELESLPYQTSGGQMKVFRSGRFLQVMTICDVKLEFDGASFVSVKIPDKYRGYTTGLCGVCDDKQNDYRTKDGTDVSQSGNRDELIGDSYKLEGESVDGCEGNYVRTSCPASFEKVVKSSKYCGIIKDENGPFGTCVKAFPELKKSYFKTCKFDVCANRNSKDRMNEVLCQALEGLAEECEDDGIAVKWRSVNTCPLSCGDPNAVYSSHGTACPATCMNLRAPANCLLPPREGCFCKKGFVTSDDKCVPQSQCGCVDSKNNYIPVGKRIVTQSCGTAIECQTQKSGPAKLVQVKIGASCHPDALCQLNSDGVRACSCKDGYIGDGYKPCKALPSTTSRVSVSVKFKNDYDDIVGGDYKAYRLHFMRAFSSVLGVSASRVTNLRIINASTIVEFDILPKRSGSAERSMSQAINILLKEIYLGTLQINDLSGKKRLESDTKSFSFVIENSKPCTCLGWGDPHYKTYDGQWIHFMGTCKYIMTQSTTLDDHCSFQVKVQNEHRGSNHDVSFTKFVDFAIYGVTVRLLKHGLVQINGENKHLPVNMQDVDLSVQRSGKLVQVKSGCGIDVEFDGDSSVSVHIPGGYRGKTEGICGSCDDKQNDFRTKDGVDVSGKENKFSLIGESYLIADESSENCTGDKSSSGTCSLEMKNQIQLSTSCGIILDKTGPFKECIADSPDMADDFFTSCKFDVCSYEKETERRNAFLCKAIEAFAEYCKGLDYNVNWRTSKLCPMRCDTKTEIYKASGTGCPATCKDPKAPEKCTLVDTEGCFCREGFIMSDAKCVNTSSCGCIDTNGEYYPLGERKTSSTCTNVFECRMVGSMATFVEVQILKCHPLAKCDIDSSGNRGCVCQEGYKGDGQTSCVSVCKERNTQFFQKGQACLSTCFSQAASVRCEPNKEKGCFCQKGYVLDNQTCVKQVDCGCMDTSGKYIKIGLSVPGKKCGEQLVCKKGLVKSSMVIKSAGNTCHGDAICTTSRSGAKYCKCKPGYTGDGVTSCSKPKRCFCMVSSSTRYRTYDRQRFDFTGTCKYILSQTLDTRGNCSFNVEVKNEHRYGNTKRAYTKYVEVDVHGIRIGLFKGSRIEVDSKRKYLPFSRSQYGLKVFQSGRYIMLLNDCGLQVKFDGKHIASVKVPGTYRSKMTGLCGDCNGKKDDYRTKAGKDVSKEKNKADLIGLSYKVPGESCD